jgi:hypothetical protein
VYDASLMYCTDIFATDAEAATNMVPVPHPPRNYIKTVHVDDAFFATAAPKGAWRR